MGKKASVIVTFEGIPAPLLQPNIERCLVDSDVFLITLPDSQEAHALRNSMGDIDSKSDAILLLSKLDQMAREAGKRAVATEETHLTGHRLYKVFIVG